MVSKVNIRLKQTQALCSFHCSPNINYLFLIFRLNTRGNLLEFPEIQAFFLAFQEEIRHMQTSLASPVIVRQRP